MLAWRTWNGFCRGTGRADRRPSRLRAPAHGLALLPIAALAAAVPLVLGAGTARAEYRLGAGDRVEVSVFGAPEMLRRAAINSDGEIALPLAGFISLKGLTLPEAKAVIEGKYRESGVIKRPDVIIDIVEYRPYFIAGDVARPGSFPFQPGMTVRNAVTVAGGYDMIKFRFGTNPFLMAADLRSDFETQRNDLFRETIRHRRIQAEIDGTSTFDTTPPDDLAVAPDFAAAIAAAETKLLAERTNSFAQEKQSVERGLAFAQDQLKSVEDQGNGEAQGVKQQEDDLAKIAALNDKGVIPGTRVVEEQRSLVATRARYLQTIGQVSLLKRTVEELGRQRTRLDENRRTDLLRDLQESEMQIDRFKSRLQATAEKYGVVGQTRSTATTGDSGGVTYTIHRRESGKEISLDATEATEILPDDAVEVVLRPGRLFGAERAAAR